MPAQILAGGRGHTGGFEGHFRCAGVFGTSVLTAVTAQNTLGVSAVHPIPTDIIAAQIAAIQEDFQIRAYKIGMLGTAEIIECVAEQTVECDFGKRVLDPVMIAKGGAPLLETRPSKP